MQIGGSKANSNPPSLTSLKTYSAVLAGDTSVGTANTQLLTLSLPAGTFIFLGNVQGHAPSAALTLRPFLTGMQMVGSALGPNYGLPFAGSGAPDASIGLAVVGILAVAGTVILGANTTAGTITVSGTGFTVPTYLQAIKVA